MSKKFTYEGFDFICQIEADNGHPAPWKNDDGHGIVSRWRRKDSKRPGERILWEMEGECLFYDWQATMRKAAMS